MLNSVISDHVEVLEVVVEEGVIFLDGLLQLTGLFDLIVDYGEIHSQDFVGGWFEFYPDYEGNVAPAPTQKEAEDSLYLYEVVLVVFDVFDYNRRTQILLGLGGDAALAVMLELLRNVLPYRGDDLLFLSLLAPQRLNGCSHEIAWSDEEKLQV